MEPLSTNNLPQVAPTRELASVAVAAKAKAMVESRYGMALRSPRNEDQARQDILKECARPGFAHNPSTLYRKPIGAGVEGLGIRFVEAALRHWRNVLVEVEVIFADEEREIHSVTVTDLEKNTTYPMQIIVSRTVERSKPADGGGYISVRTNSYGKPAYTIAATDDDLLNKRGALISKAMRTLGLRIIPGDIQDEAEALIRKIRADKAAADPDGERKAIADGFAKLNVRVDMLNSYLQHDIATCSPAELVDLRGMWEAIRDGEATWQGYVDAKREEELRKTQSAGDADAAGNKTAAGSNVADLNAGIRAAVPGDASGRDARRSTNEATTTKTPAMSLAQMIDRAKQAKTTDEIDLLRDLVRYLPEDQRAEANTELGRLRDLLVTGAKK